MTIHRDHGPTGLTRAGPVPRGPWLPGALAVASLVAGAGTALWPGLLAGTAVMDGSARGTGVVVTLVGVPTLVVSWFLGRRGSVAAATVFLGSAAYLTYNAVMFCFATPLNSLFPAYVAMLGAGVLLLANAVPPLVSCAPDFDRRLLRVLGGWIVTVTLLNAALWLRQVLEAVLSAAPTDSLAGTGLTTNPVWVQDLAVWLPVMLWLGLGAIGVIRARPALVTAGIAFWTLEGIGVAVDQWWGHRADPTSAWASPGAVWLFLATAVVDLVLLSAALRQLAGRPHRPDTGFAATGRGAGRVGRPSRPRMQAD